MTDPKQGIRRFCFGRLEIRAAAEPQQAGHDLVRRGNGHSALPTKSGRSVAHCSNGMATIMLAVAPRAHAVFPRLAPVNRADADEDPVAGKRFSPPRVIDCRALFKHMI